MVTDTGSVSRIPRVVAGAEHELRTRCVYVAASVFLARLHAVDVDVALAAAPVGYEVVPAASDDCGGGIVPVVVAGTA